MISIHAPREGGDNSLYGMMAQDPVFQSTPPARGATTTAASPRAFHRISIHAPREGGDSGRTYKSYLGIRHFNPRPPRGGRLLRQFIKQTDNLTFQSTPPARGATLRDSEYQTFQPYFNPRPPRGGRLHKSTTYLLMINFNPRPPRGGRLKNQGQAQ